MKKSILVLGAFIGLLATSCGKLLVVTPPNAIIDEQIQELLAQGGERAEEVISQFAGPMPLYFDYTNIGIGSGSANASTNSLQGINVMNAFMGNDIAWGCPTSIVEDYTGVTTYRLAASNRVYDSAMNGAHWYGYAPGINQSNLLLSYTEYLSKESELYKKSAAAGKAVRAFSYMSLMEEYTQAYCNMIQETAENSGMSLYTEYHPGQDPVARETAQKTYEFILADINDAITNLKGLAPTDQYTHANNQLEDIDLGVVNFLKARVGLFIGGKKVNGKTGWEICKEACDEIINNGGYSFINADNWGGKVDSLNVDDTQNNFFPEKNAFTCVRREVNPETILGYVIGSGNTDGGRYQNALLNIYGSYGTKNIMARIDDRLYAKIADNDCRKQSFAKNAIGVIHVGAGSPATMPTYCNLKFISNHALDQNSLSHEEATDNATKVEFCKFRLSEVYLMSAEAELALSNPTGATNRLNALLAARKTSGTLTVANYGGVDYSSRLDEFTKLQWSVEMWGEGGREYFNNKRWKIDINRAGSTVHADAQGNKGTWNKWQDMTLAFPQNEVLYNPDYKEDKVNSAANMK